MENKHHIDPLEGAVALLSGRWKLLILRELIGGSRRFGELRRALTGITQKVLTETLRDLEEQGLILRTVYEETTLRVTYSLTAAGYKFIPVLQAMSKGYSTMTEKLHTDHRKYYAPTPQEEAAPLQQRIQAAREALQQADAVIIGTGSELHSGAVDFFSRSFAAEWMPHLSHRRTFTLDEMIDVYMQIDDTNTDAYWKFWAPFMHHVSNLTPPEHLLQLAEFTASRNSFVITTNADGLEEKAGVPRDRIYRPMGDYSRLQCAMPCCDETYDAAPYISLMADIALQGGEIRPDMIPRCPVCGGYLVPNHFRTRIVSLAGDDRGRKDYWEFYRRHRGGKVVFLELGCSMRFPAAIHAPFADAAAANENAYLIRCSTRYADAVSPSERTLVFSEPQEEILRVLLEK